MHSENTESGEDEESSHREMRDPSIGAPDDFWSEIERSDEVDNRIPEKHDRAESRPEQQAGSVTVPLEKVGAPGVTSNHVTKYGITMDEARFMRAVVKAMNRDLQGYDLTESMIGIRDHYDIDEEKLIQAGYLKRHTGVDRRIYYTVTFGGQEACRLAKEQGQGYGDIGADTPHRVGTELARRYYQSLPHVYMVELAVRRHGQKTDLIVTDDELMQLAVIEVEGGRIRADPNVSEVDRTGITNYESVQSDYGLLAESDGDSVWVVRNYEIAGDILQILSSGDDIPFELPKDVIQSVKDTNMRIKDLNEDHIDPLQDDGISEVVTFRQLRNRIKEMDGYSG